MHQAALSRLNRRSLAADVPGAETLIGTKKPLYPKRENGLRSLSGVVAGEGAAFRQSVWEPAARAAESNPRQPQGRGASCTVLYS